MLVEIENLAFRYGRQQILADVSAALQAGEIVALAGANGSGKTTLMHLLLGDLQPQNGSIRYASDLYKPNSIAYVPDKPPLYPDWTVQEFLMRMALERGVTSVRHAVEIVVQRCYLQDVLNEPCKTLSHGYRQRVSLAQALLHAPRWLCMDEPMNGLDEAQRYMLRDTLKNLAAEGMAVLLVLHDLLDITLIADRVWYLHQGRLYTLSCQNAQDIWAVFSSEEAAGNYQTGIQEGKARGFLWQEYQQIADELLADEALRSLSREYPPVALWARMQACRQS